MSSLTMVEARLPPGFRFHPRDDELVCDYLMKKLDGCDSPLLIEVDLTKCEPWDIPAIACVGGNEWYFYNQRGRKYSTGQRTNRATATGYWKATGKDRPVARRGGLVGMRKTLVFYQGRAPKGNKTHWVMHEFRIEGPFHPPSTIFTNNCNSKQEDWVLCRVFYKNRSNEVSSSPKTELIENDTGSMEETSSSSGLPPLMDSYITFDQTQVNNAYLQVPCFSITSSSSTNYLNNNPNPNPNPNPIFLHNFHMQHDADEPNNNNNNHAITKIHHHHHHHHTFGENIMQDDSPTNNNLSPLACDKKVLEAVLSHLTKIETTSPNSNHNNNISSSNFGEVASSHIALPPHMWNHF